ncbi:MAG: hypothetical protein FJX80_03590 [Bacteroidetes bacterium]|nr:hypothetical protein [Bacteroidota bacterium]
MEFVKLTIGDIMQANIIYYDELTSQACVDICSYLKIDNLPALDGKHFYKFNNQSFSRHKIRKIHSTFIDTPIFDETLEVKFLKNEHNVLFVFFGETLHGVVHISDYNRNIVLQKVQDDLLLFERNLRQLILLSGFDNIDMLKYFEYKLQKDRSDKKKKFFRGKIERYKQMENEINSLGPFQLFEFSDLLNFCNSSFTHRIFTSSEYEFNGISTPAIEILRWLRNMAMHGKNPISKKEEKSIYSIESLSKFKSSLNVLKAEMSKINYLIRNNKDFIKSLELENRSKLEIIYSHHPRALEYFLGL